MTKRYNDPIDVECAVEHPGTLRPLAFSWRGRRYAVGSLLKYWREAGEAWDPIHSRDHECFRVEAEGGVYDLRYDRLAGPRGGAGALPPAPWRLARVWD